MAGRLAGKIALVLGAGAVGPGWGNGRATAALFAREGAAVFGVDRSEDALAETAQSIAKACSPPMSQTSPGPTRSRRWSRPARSASAGSTCWSTMSAARRRAIRSACRPEVWASQLDHNLTYVFHSCKHVIPIMVRQGGGAIVNLASIAALRYFGADVAAYAAAKAGLIHFSRVTAVKYAPHNVRINTVVPGLMHTPLVEARLAGERAGGDVEKLIAARHRQVPMGRMGDGWDVAHAVLFLASDEARYITATELVVDGGLSATCVAPHPDAD